MREREREEERYVHLYMYNSQCLRVNLHERCERVLDERSSLETRSLCRKRFIHPHARKSLYIH